MDWMKRVVASGVMVVRSGMGSPCLFGGLYLCLFFVAKRAIRGRYMCPISTIGGVSRVSTASCEYAFLPLA